MGDQAVQDPPLGPPRKGRGGEEEDARAPGARLFEAVSDAVRDNGWAVSELRLEAGRLDEVFRQVTRGETA